MCKIHPRRCAIGRTQIHGSDFSESSPLVIGTCPGCYRMALAASWKFIEVVLDVTNYFQNTILYPDYIFYVMVSPYYLQGFWRRYPRFNIKYSKWVQRVLQACNGIQGTKSSGKNWWIALDKVLTAYVLINVPYKQALYILARYYK